MLSTLRSLYAVRPQDVMPRLRLTDDQVIERAHKDGLITLAEALEMFAVLDAAVLRGNQSGRY